jgi:hypothetical protein
MPIVGFLETELHAGTINTDQSFSAQHNFGSPLTVWSRPYLQQVSVNDDDGSVILWISKFVDKNGSHTGPFHPGVFAEKCTSVTFAMYTNDCIATAVLTSEIFG